MLHLDHVALWCRDLEALAAFYVRWFGAEPGPRYHNPGKGFESAFLSFGTGSKVELMTSTVISLDATAPGAERMGLAHLAFSVGPDAAVDALTAQLREAGYAVASDPRRTGDGYYESVVLDPEGNRVEITGMHVDRVAPRFLDCTLPKEEWTHQAHLAVGLWHVERFGPDEALDRLRAGIRRLNESHGNENTATDGYHETITWAYAELLSQFAAACPVGLTLQQRVARLLSGPLGAREALLRYYSRERLMSVEARARLVAPDLAPLRLSDLRDESPGGAP